MQLANVDGISERFPDRERIFAKFLANEDSLGE